jgi:hypothetical protein
MKDCTKFKLIEGRNFDCDEDYVKAIAYYKELGYSFVFAQTSYKLADCCTVLSIKGGE